MWGPNTDFDRDRERGPETLRVVRLDLEEDRLIGEPSCELGLEAKGVGGAEGFSCKR